MDGTPLPALSLDAVEGLVKVGFALLGVWLFCVGASIGSFLNVVVYRLPLGKNLVTPGSCCPVCGHAIRARHNIPILGWLSLGGRCFDCRTPISSRYPLVEALLGTIFILLGIELLLGGSNLVDVSREPWNRLPWPTLARAYSMHAILATTLIGAALIEFDGRRIPPLLFVPTIFFSLLWPLLFSQTRPESIWFGERELWQSCAEGAAGFLGGAALGLLIDAAWRLTAPQRLRPPFAPVWTLASIGVALGWRGLIIVAFYGTLLFAIFVICTRGRRRWKLPWPACLTLALLVVVPTYRAGWLSGGSPAATPLFVYELAVASIAGLFAIVVRTTPARYWRRAPRSFPLEHAAATPLDPAPVESPSPEIPAAEPPSPESTHDS